MINLWPAVGQVVDDINGNPVPTNGIVVSTPDFLSYYQALVLGGRLLTYDPLNSGGSPSTLYNAGAVQAIDTYTILGAIRGEYDTAQAETNDGFFWRWNAASLAAAAVPDSLGNGVLAPDPLVAGRWIQKLPVGSGGGGPLGGDVTGAIGANTVTKIRNVPVDTTAPTTGQFLAYDGAKWLPTSVAPGGSNATQIQGDDVIAGANDNEVLFRLAGDWTPARPFEEVLNVKDDRFGAIGDGASHPLSSRFASLAAAQAVYPFATSLTQQIDQCAIQLAINTAIQSPIAGYGRVGVFGVYIPAGEYYVSTQIELFDCASVHLYGTSMFGTRINWVGAAGGTVFDCDGVFSMISDLTIIATTVIDVKGVRITNKVTGNNWVTTNWTIKRVNFDARSTGRFIFCITVEYPDLVPPGSVSNNDFHKAIACRFRAYSDTAFHSDGSQAHGHKILDCDINGSGTGQYGVRSTYGAYFHVDGGTGGHHTVADFAFVGPFITGSIRRWNTEQSARFVLFGTLTATAYPFEIANCRVDHSVALPADGKSIIQNTRGPLVVTGCYFFAASANPYIYVGGGGSGDRQATINGCSFFGPSKYSLTPIDDGLGEATWGPIKYPYAAASVRYPRVNGQVLLYQPGVDYVPFQFPVYTAEMGASLACDGTFSRNRRGKVTLADGLTTRTVYFSEINGQEAAGTVLNVGVKIGKITGTPPANLYAYVTNVTVNGFDITINTAASAFSVDVTWEVEAEPSEPDIASLTGLVDAWDASTGLTKAGGGTPADGDLIEAWTGSLGLVLQNLTAGQQPTWNAVDSGFGKYGPSIVFDGGDWLVSTLPASSWRGLHYDGWTAYIAYFVDPSATSFDGLLGTRTAELSTTVGVVAYTSTSTSLVAVGNGTTNVVSDNISQYGHGQPSWLGFNLTPTNMQSRGSGKAFTIKPHGITLSASDPASTLYVGRSGPSGSPLLGRIKHLRIYNVTHTYDQMDVVARWFQWKFGVRI